MRCPKCSHLDDKVIDTRSVRNGQAIRRRRVLVSSDAGPQHRGGRDHDPAGDGRRARQESVSMSGSTGTTTCCVLTHELRRTLQQLGLDTKLYTIDPMCEGVLPADTVDDLVAKATGRHERVLAVHGDCSGDVGGVGVGFGQRLGV